MIDPSPRHETVDNSLEAQSPVKALLRLTETAAFLRSTDGRFNARVQVRGRPEICALGSPPFRAWLKDEAGRACLTHPSSFRLHPSAQGIAPPNAHARRLHYVSQNRRKAFHRDHEHKTSDTGRVATSKWRWHRQLLRRAESRRPGRNSNPRDGVTLVEACGASKHARV